MKKFIPEISEKELAGLKKLYEKLQKFGKMTLIELNKIFLQQWSVENKLLKAIPKLIAAYEFKVEQLVVANKELDAVGKENKRLEKELKEQLDYSISLQQLIEHYCDIIEKCLMS